MPTLNGASRRLVWLANQLAASYSERETERGRFSVTDRFQALVNEFFRKAIARLRAEGWTDEEILAEIQKPKKRKRGASKKKAPKAPSRRNKL